MANQPCECSKLEWKPEHYSLEHHPDCHIERHQNLLLSESSKVKKMDDAIQDKLNAFYENDFVKTTLEFLYQSNRKHLEIRSDTVWRIHIEYYPLTNIFALQIRNNNWGCMAEHKDPIFALRLLCRKYFNELGLDTTNQIVYRAWQNP
jgi:hypothetical protein